MTIASDWQAAETPADSGVDSQSLYSAYRHWVSSLGASRQELWLLAEGRRVGHHGAMAWITGDCGYSAPEPVEPEDERARLQREYIEAARTMAKLADRIERITGPRLASA